MVFLNKVADLGGDLGAIPAHNQHLPDGPGACISEHIMSSRNQLTGQLYGCITTSSRRRGRAGWMEPAYAPVNIIP